jgi:hypothetical protein
MATEESYLWSYRLPGFVAKLCVKFLRDLRGEHEEKPWFPLFEVGVHSARHKLPDIPPSAGATTTYELQMTYMNLEAKRTRPPG